MLGPWTHQGPAEQAVAQRVENSAVRAAIMASNEVQSEHSHKAFLMRPAAVQPLTATAMPPTMTVSSSTPGAAQVLVAYACICVAYVHSTCVCVSFMSVCLSVCRSVCPPLARVHVRANDGMHTC